MFRGLCSLIVVLLLAVHCTAFHNSTRYGILYINEIIANSDTRTVQIDGSFVEDNILRLDVIEEWSGNGIITEGIFLTDTNAFIYDDFVVNPPTFLPQDWNLFFNGGMLADSPQEDLFSFQIDDDTGRTSIRGTLFPFSGLRLDTDAFVIKRSGETIIRDALLNANGGIDINNGKWVVDSDSGSLSTRNYINIEGDIFIGNSSTSDRLVARKETTEKFGGPAFIEAQDAIVNGGNLFLIPGSGEQQNGNIFFGREQGDNIIVQRQLESLTDGTAGALFIEGQSSSNGNGGSVFIMGGTSEGNGNGGDIILAPGYTQNDDNVVITQGRIYFGTDVEPEANFDLVLERPTLPFGDGGDTFVIGQSTQNGNAGDLVLRGGHVYDNGGDNALGGDVWINPGFNENNVQGDIIIGNAKAADLLLTRFVPPSPGGDTVFRGQDGNSGNGGDVYVRAGISDGPGNGGSLHFIPGLSGTGAPLPDGDIFWGQRLHDLTVTRVPTNGGGLATYFVGQESAQGRGGDYLLQSGSGGTSSGTLFLNAGSASNGRGGSVEINAGNGDRNGGTVNIRAGDGAGESGNGGNTILTSGSSASDNPGNVYINAGSGAGLGRVIVEESHEINMPVTIKNSYFSSINEAGQNQDVLIIRPDPTSLINLNGRTILRSKADYPVVYPPDPNTITDENVFERIVIAQHSFNSLLNVLGQCQHGLISNNIGGTPRDCLA